MTMASSLLLDVTEWDLVLDASGNIAVAAEPYSLAQNAASAIKTFLGEVYYDVTVGVPYLQQIFGKNPPLPLLKSTFEAAAITVPGVAAAKCFITAAGDRNVSGQIQVTAAATGRISVANFSVVNPQVQ